MQASEANLLLRKIAAVEGYGTPAKMMREIEAEEGVDPGALPCGCATTFCNFVEWLEPDTAKGHCPRCDKESLWSIAVLAIARR